MKIKKIACFITTLGQGGATRSTLKIAEELAKDSFKVDLVVGNICSDILDIIPNNINIINLNADRLYKIFFPLRSYISNFRPDYLLSSSAPNNIVSIWANKLVKHPVPIGVIERVAPTLEAAGHENIKYRFLPFLIKKSYKYADHIISVSRGTANDLAQLLKISPSTINVIYNPVITQEKIKKSYYKFEHPWFKKNTPVIVSLGRLVEQKDFQTLIRAFSLLRNEITCKLVIMGEGPLRPKLKDLIRDLKLEDDVELPGFISNPHPFLRSANLFVLSSAWEGLPNVLLEAMAYGTPVVSTDCLSGPSEILLGGKLAPLVSVGDYNSMYKAMKQQLSKNINTEQLVDRAKEFSVNQSIKKYVDLINTILE